MSWQKDVEKAAGKIALIRAALLGAGAAASAILGDLLGAAEQLLRLFVS